MRFAARYLLASLPCGAPPVIIPTTPAGTVLKAWLDAINSGDRSRITSYLAKYEPAHNAAVDQLISFHDQTGGFTLLRIEKVSRCTWKRS